MKLRWTIGSCSDARVDSLAADLGVSPLLARLLILRGLTDVEKAFRFLHPRLQDLHDPYLMRGMDLAVERIERALAAGEKILIYGDYDVDGITSTVVLRRALEMLGGIVDYHIPARLREGYGLRTEVLERYRRLGYRLVVTVDCGIRAFEVGEQVRSLGLDLLITDHHPPDHRLPDAYAILNPRQPGCRYPEKNLAGVGVVFKLVEALFRRSAKEAVLPHFLKMVALGTIADMVPLTGENRVLARFGLEGLGDPRNLGLRLLLEGVGVGEPVTFFDVGFKLAPRINAVTRMGGGREVVDLFSMDDPSAVRAVVQEMNEKNRRRREEEERILAEVEETIAREPESFRRRFLVVGGRGWHRGVIGIVASRLAERFHRPTLVLSVEGASVQGSGRSIPGYSLLEALEDCRDRFDRYGGHAQAVGCSVEKSSDPEGLIRELAERLESHARRHLSPDLLSPPLNLDAVLPAEALSLELLEEIERLAPFGAGNPAPVFASKNVPVAGGPRVLKGRHLKFEVGANGSRVEAIWWKNGAAADTIADGSRLDVAYALTRNLYRGRERLVLTVRDLRRADETGS